MEYRKERNLICAYDGDKFRGAWDISTGGFIGVKGNPVKNRPADLFSDIFNNYYCRIYNFYNETFRYINYAPYKSRFEQFISLKLYPDSLVSLKSTDKLTKDLVAFLHNYCNGVYSDRSVQCYKLLKQYNFNFEQANKKIIFIAERFVADDIVKIDDNFIKLLNILQHEHLIETTNDYELGDKIYDFYKMNLEMYEKIEIKRNFMTNYYMLKYLYRKYIDENYDNILKQKNDKPYLYYENEQFIAYPIFTREDFHTEAEYQHNCVERIYMNEVFKGKTHIVVIRHKNDIHTPYITCEVHDASIYQYLTRFNREVHDDIALEFRKLYSKHLKESSDFA